MPIIKNKMLPTMCPSCRTKLYVEALRCIHCKTRIEGEYRLPVFMRLSLDEQEFALNFIESRGSLKEMASKLGLSYPTVRNRLDEVIEHLRNHD